MRIEPRLSVAQLAEIWPRPIPDLPDFCRRRDEMPTDDTDSGWRPIETAPRDGTPIWALIHSDLSIRFQLERLAAWNGRQIPLRHEGKTPSDYDLGWSVAAPLGYGGIPDSWVAGWMPLPPPPESGP